MVTIKSLLMMTTIKSSSHEFFEAPIFTSKSPLQEIESKEQISEKCTKKVYHKISRQSKYNIITPRSHS